MISVDLPGKWEVIKLVREKYPSVSDSNLRSTAKQAGEVLGTHKDGRWLHISGIMNCTEFAQYLRLFDFSKTESGCINIRLGTETLLEDLTNLQEQVSFWLFDKEIMFDFDFENRKDGETSEIDMIMRLK